MSDDARGAALAALGPEVMRLAARRSTSYEGSVLDQSAFRILWRLVEDGPKSLTDLADELQLERSTVSRQVSAAVTRGLVERTADEDLRVRTVRPTAAGLAAYRNDIALRAAVWGAAVAELGVDRARALAAELRSFNDALDRAHGHGAPEG
ncbi:winged helix-turn-helix transcriptional regulator [Nocardioides sp. ChNu-153]|uniref:MarR family winged helix-turn-helix transcriptional regulator n=1 Tax=unclassified Nocardioides TaxID=2615069 RepID=UPI0024070A98|nr:MULTISPECIES: MarR family winged helix-turn-helix transcriptional regulator [unclassified Nocardioides]MDF9715116.1 MarR family winged helix-turn-helix transcriptional regulator [Nocardioides sp. ChNu-99]MDN7122384.1 winged helix-turn-helix transcriptional regulator [Nocardioides sp. ChNu-153]